MPADFRITWTLAGHGWADCTVEANAVKLDLTASYISSAPEDLLTAVARLVAGETETRAQFEAEPTAFRWIFYREEDALWLRLLELRRGGDHDNAGTELWSGALSVDALARAVVRCFDEVADVYGESGYRGKWGEHFPRDALETLRRIRQKHRPATDPSPPTDHVP
ncbi:hypothetical protein [Streptomyces sp. NEAU-L66]|uniref:hypothetical protein n=1 Tax=Streptomyces sp. NEAU-L66 TaxID=3390812 RepID=UPI0039C61048